MEVAVIQPMLRTRSIVLAAALMCLAVPSLPPGFSGAQAGEQVDLELVLAIDISGSVDADEARLQREGYVNAFRDPQVIRAIRGGINGRIAVTYFEWASYQQYKLVMDWVSVHDAASSNALAGQLAELPISRGMRTSISGAIEYAITLFERSPYEGVRRVIDISGDGPNNDGGLITIFRDRAVSRGITINGLPVFNTRANQYGFPNLPDLDLYYQGCVIGGPGSFIEVARDFADFDRAVRRKLIMEIAGLAPDAAPPSQTTRWAARPLRERGAVRSISGVTYAPGCDVGEKQSREFWRSRSLN
jgi:hypothetical protein